MKSGKKYILKLLTFQKYNLKADKLDESHSELNVDTKEHKLYFLTLKLNWKMM